MTVFVKLRTKESLKETIHKKKRFLHITEKRREKKRKGDPYYSCALFLINSAGITLCILYRY